MTQDQPLDLCLAAGSYLRSPDGETRVIHGLERLARDLLRAGVRVVWGWVPGNRAACSYWWRGEIVLSPWLFWCEPFLIRYCLAHELGHCATCRASDERACDWQKRYADLIEPEWLPAGAM